MIDVNEVKAIIRRFEDKEGVRGVIICDSSGLPIKSNLDIEMTEEVSAYDRTGGGIRCCLWSLMHHPGLVFRRSLRTRM